MWEKLHDEVMELADRYQDDEARYAAYTTVLDLMYNMEIDEKISLRR